MGDDDRDRQAMFEQVQMPLDFANTHPESVEVLSKHHLIYSMAGLGLGLACIVGGIVLFMNGIVLFMNGIVGSTSWTARFLGAESTINDAAPGAVLFIVGLFMVFITRYVFRIQK